MKSHMRLEFESGRQTSVTNPQYKKKSVLVRASVTSIPSAVKSIFNRCRFWCRIELAVSPFISFIPETS